MKTPKKKELFSLLHLTVDVDGSLTAATRQMTSGDQRNMWNKSYRWVYSDFRAFILDMQHLLVIYLHLYLFLKINHGSVIKLMDFHPTNLGSGLLWPLWVTGGIRKGIQPNAAMHQEKMHFIHGHIWAFMMRECTMVIGFFVCFVPTI